MLSIFGEKDVLVPQAENKGRMEIYLKQAGVKHQIATIDDCGHDMLTRAEAGGDGRDWPYTY